MTRLIGGFWSAVAVAALLVPGAVHAQAAPPRVLSGAVDLGYATASGNTRTTTFSLGENLVWNASKRVIVRQKLRSIYGKADTVVNANLLDIDASADFTVEDGFAVTIGAGYDRNRFAGISSRYEQSIGVAYRFAPARRDSVRVTGGILWTQQTSTTEIQRNYVAFRAASVYRHTFTPASFFQHAMEYIPNITNSTDWRFNSESSLSAALTKKIGLKMSYTIRYDHLPEPTFQTTDRIFTTGVQLSY